MANYQLTNKAVEDLTSIWLYAREVWTDQLVTIIRILHERMDIEAKF